MYANNLVGQDGNKKKNLNNFNITKEPLTTFNESCTVKLLSERRNIKNTWKQTLIP